MDVLKNRMQMNKEWILVRRVIKLIIYKEGVLKLYAGLGAGLLRQATYTTTRLGIYNQFQVTYMCVGEMAHFEGGPPLV
jgi:solute carrier family 25 oxoglutarate transporter 11